MHITCFEPDFSINYKNEQMLIRNCWEIYLFTALPTQLVKREDIQETRFAVQSSLSIILLARQNAHLCSTSQLEVEAKAILKNTQELPKWFRELDFKISKGKNHPSRD